MTETILEVKNINIALDGQSIIEGLNFDLGRGGNLAIIGPNGSGKTVFLKALMDMVNFSGEINWIPGIRIGYVPQKIDADRHLPVTIKNLLDSKARVLGMPISEIRQIEDSVRLTQKILLTPIGHLSGGEFQRALIAFALLGKPDVLILDEPTASIDERGEEQIYELIHELQDKYNLTVILVSHDLNFVYRYATKVLCLNKTGVCYGSPEELTPKVLEKLYGGAHKYFHHIHESK